KRLDQAGWGVIFPFEPKQGIREALGELLALRKEQAGDLYRECTYRTDEGKNEFLTRHKAAPGAAVPKRLPYYLLIVGSPDEIPYSFQYQLDVQYAVGRIHFNQ